MNPTPPRPSPHSSARSSAPTSPLADPPLHVQGDPLGEALTRALEAQPTVIVPAGFAARVAAQASSLPGATRTPAFPAAPIGSTRFGNVSLRGARPRFGASAIHAVLVVLAVATLVLALAPGAARPVWISLDLAFALELVALTLFVSLRSFTRP